MYSCSNTSLFVLDEADSVCSLVLCSVAVAIAIHRQVTTVRGVMSGNGTGSAKIMEQKCFVMFVPLDKPIKDARERKKPRSTIHRTGVALGK